MLSKLSGGHAAAGTRAAVKAIENDRAAMAFVAQDADLFIKNKIRGLCEQKGVRLVDADSMKALGLACGLSVGCAAAVLLKD